MSENIIRSATTVYEVLPPGGIGAPPWYCDIRTLPDRVFVAQVRSWGTLEEAMESARRLARRLALADDVMAGSKETCGSPCGRNGHAPNRPAAGRRVTEEEK